MRGLLIAAGLALRGNQHQSGTLVSWLRLPGTPESVQNADYRRVAGNQPEQNRRDYGEAKYERREERNHNSTNLMNELSDAVGCVLV